MTSYESTAICLTSCVLLAGLANLRLSRLQLKELRRQRTLDLNAKINDVNRDLLSKALDDVDLESCLQGKFIENPEKQARYIQMWLNQALLMWIGRDSGLIQDDSWYSLERDIRRFVNLEPVKEHWQKVAPFYPPKFANFVNGLAHDLETFTRV